MDFAPRDPDFEARVRASFARQRFMATCGARIERVAPGEVELRFDHREDLTQQHGFVHAGVLATVADSACGYAALTLMDADSAVLSVEFKINLLAPAAGAQFRVVGRVVRAGRTLTVCAAEVHAWGGDGVESAPIAVMQATMIALRDRPGLSG
ncbi:MAG: PaaI family thioesterase [Candidatus Eisenbacteria bacterium]